MLRVVCAGVWQDAPITLDGLKLLLSRESAKEPPQTWMISFSGSDAASSTEKCLTNFPHPYPQVMKQPRLLLLLLLLLPLLLLLLLFL